MNRNIRTDKIQNPAKTKYQMVVTSPEYGEPLGPRRFRKAMSDDFSRAPQTKSHYKRKTGGRAVRDYIINMVNLLPHIL